MEEREAIYDEVLIEMLEGGESLENAQIIAQSMAQLYDKKTKL